MSRVSIVIATHDRADLLARALSSVFAQDMTDLDVIVVDDGSTDHTREILERVVDDRLTVLRHERNRGVRAAKNTGLDHVTGEWFTFLDDDDEIVPHALSTMLAVPEAVDRAITAVTCNCVDSQTGAFTGRGLTHDQWLDEATRRRCCRGEFWGITQTALLGELRFNERVRLLDVLWLKIGARARRYYIHQGLRLYHTEGTDRVTHGMTAVTAPDRYDEFVALLDEEQEYLRLLRALDRDGYRRLLGRAAYAFVLRGDRSRAASASRLLGESGVNPWWIASVAGLRAGPRLLRGSAATLSGGKRLWRAGKAIRGRERRRGR